ncbi:probable ubiquitin-conjugating enzyme E2 25 [Chenopodium quinoa]|nr:probable ubiquitin-conjugating enzyme E2 25 [Chenopodium quinoa]
MTSLSDNKFPQFDAVSNLSDHHFAGKHPRTPSMPTTAQKKIMQEWKLFKKDLPETIFVRAYETRMDLLRAAIVGARGTPYHDGLFFFDIAFPVDYPAKPPLVHYQSFGYRINPNLYNNGRVCLSLLNTWSGKKCEKWDPNKSTILQLLLSIQALVLNERPYFNEPGNAGWAGRTYGEKKSLAYSEEVFVLSCKTMLCVLRRPPKNFEQLVTEHFKDSAEFILNACDAYRKGLAGVGLFNGVLKGTKAEVSVKFKGAVNQVYGELMVALSKTGASVDLFVQQFKEEEEQKAKEKAAAAKNKVGGFGKSVVQKLKKIMSLGSILKKKSQKSKTIPV